MGGGGQLGDTAAAAAGGVLSLSGTGLTLNGTLGSTLGGTFPARFTRGMVNKNVSQVAMDDGEWDGKSQVFDRTWRGTGTHERERYVEAMQRTVPHPNTQSLLYHKVRDQRIKPGTMRREAGERRAAYAARKKSEQEVYENRQRFVSSYKSQTALAAHFAPGTGPRAQKPADVMGATMADGLAGAPATRATRNHDAHPGYIGGGADAPDVKVRGSTYFASQMKLEHASDLYAEPRTTGRKAFHGTSTMFEVMSAPNTGATTPGATRRRAGTPGVFDGDEQDPFLSTTALVELAKAKAGKGEAAERFRPVDTIPIKMYTTRRSKSGRHNVRVEDGTWGTAAGEAFQGVGGVPVGSTRDGARPGPRADPITGDGAPDKRGIRRREVAMGHRAAATMSSLAFVEPDRATSYGHHKWLKGTGYPMRPAPYDFGDEGAKWESAKQESDRNGQVRTAQMKASGQLTDRAHVIRTASNVLLGADRAKTISLMKDSFPALTRAHVEARAREQITFNRRMEFKRADNIRRLE